MKSFPIYLFLTLITVASVHGQQQNSASGSTETTMKICPGVGQASDFQFDFHCSPGSKDQLVLTSLTLETSSARKIVNPTQEDVLSGWCGEKKGHSQQAFWIGTIIPKGKSSATISIALDGILNGRSSFASVPSQLKLYLSLDDRFAGSSTGCIQYAPITAIELAPQGSLSVSSQKGWTTQKGSENYEWKGSLDSNKVILSAVFQPVKKAEEIFLFIVKLVVGLSMGLSLNFWAETKVKPLYINLVSGVIASLIIVGIMTRRLIDMGTWFGVTLFFIGIILSPYINKATKKLLEKISPLSGLK